MSSKKDLESMSEKDILVELLKEQRGETRARRITMVFMGLICCSVVVALILIVPKVTGALDDVKKATAKVGDVITTVESKVDMLDSTIKDIDGMVKNVDDLVVSNTDNLSQAAEKLNSVDFAKLNQAINDFADTVQPLSNFFNSFKIP